VVRFDTIRKPESFRSRLLESYGRTSREIAMAVYHITLHAYRSWRADHPRGYTDRKHGVLPPDPEKAQEWDDRAKHLKVEFDRARQAVLITGAADICGTSRMEITRSWNGLNACALST
jgi:hypothetical protein